MYQFQNIRAAHLAKMGLKEDGTKPDTMSESEFFEIVEGSQDDEDWNP